jgi:alanine racemase
MSATSRPSSILVDADAISANVTALKDLVAPAELCAVVKADGYGHVGAVAAAAALAGGASRLAVAVAEEAVALRRAGIDAPILLLAEVVTAEGAALVIEHRLEATVYTSEGAELLAVTASGGVEVPVHLKIDTGMHRVGVAPERALALAGAIDAEPRLRLAGTCTHLAVADDPGRPETALQLERFDGVLEAMGAAGIDPGIRHAANSAGAILHPSARHDLVRCGIAIYGIHPSTASEGVVDLAAALELRSRVSHTIRVPAGHGVSYGLHGAVDHDRTVAVVPLGYADGVDRSLGRGAGRVLVGGCPRPIVGVVTMDQFMVECGDDPVARGDEVVLLGVQGEASITAADWARWIGTIPYEVVARLGPRVPRIVRS